mmetsp:Transcript_71803/g.126794  ORF Transcript_71803/g.126794 Transcript_71803/m.126794 type:complete len:449 (-) Transcript_71803:149-1495(-)
MGASESVPCCLCSGGRAVEATGLTPRPGLAARQKAKASVVPRLALPAIKENSEEAQHLPVPTPCRAGVKPRWQEELKQTPESSEASDELPADGAAHVKAWVKQVQAAAVRRPEASRADRAKADKADAQVEASESPDTAKQETNAQQDLDSEDSDEEEEAQSVKGELLSIGSALHAEGTCKRCCFFPRGRCTNGASCEFCHEDHEKRKRKSKSERKLARLQQEETLALMPTSPTTTVSTAATPTASMAFKTASEVRKPVLQADASPFEPWQPLQQSVNVAGHGCDRCDCLNASGAASYAAMLQCSSSAHEGGYDVVYGQRISPEALFAASGRSWNDYSDYDYPQDSYTQDQSLALQATSGQNAYVNQAYANYSWEDGGNVASGNQMEAFYSTSLDDLLSCTLPEPLELPARYETQQPTQWSHEGLHQVVYGDATVSSTMGSSGTFVMPR